MELEKILTVKPIKTMEEIKQTIRIQKAAWDLVDLEVIPTFEMKAISDVGIVLGAFTKENEIIGMIYGYHHFPDRHYSHMMAVLPEWQGKGVGFFLKKAHRRIALNSEHIVNFIEWTVDPLLPNNAFLNFSKLGGICRKYYVDYYGDASAFGLYRGLPTDRFLVEWPIRSERAERRIKDYKKDRVSKEELLKRSPPINNIKDDRWVSLDRDIDSLRSFSVQVPADFQRLRKEKLQIAIDWRIRFRDISQKTLGKGWVIIDYHSFKEDDKRTNFYEFIRKEEIDKDEILGVN